MYIKNSALNYVISNYPKFIIITNYVIVKTCENLGCDTLRKIKSNLKQLLESKGWEQKKLSEVTGIREATISEMCRNINKTYPRQVLLRIADALEINDINEIIEIEKEPT